MLRFRRIGLKPKDISTFEDIIILARNGKHFNLRSCQSASSSAVEFPSQWFGKPSSRTECHRLSDISEMQRLLADEISDALDDAVDLETHESISNSIHHRDSEFEGNIWNLSIPEIKSKSPGQKMRFNSVIPHDYCFDPDLYCETKFVVDSNRETSTESPLDSKLIHVSEPFDLFHDKVYERFAPLADNQRTTLVSPDFLISLLRNNDLNGIRKELSENLWPLISCTSKEINQIFSFFISSCKTSEDIAEVLSVLSDLSNQQPYAVLNKSLLFEFIKKSCEIPKPEKSTEIYGAKKTLEVIIKIKKLFPHDARHFSRSKLLSFFESMFNNADTDFISASKVCSELINIDLVPNRKVFLEVAAKYLIEKLPYDDAFYKWSNACSVDNIVSGGYIFLEHVLSDKKISIKLQEKRINQLVKFYERVLSPSDLIAQLIVSLVSTGRLADAKSLWLKCDVDCKHFLSPLHNLKSVKFVDVDLVHIRDFAHLFEECVLAELKPKKRSYKKNISEEESTDDANIKVADVEVAAKVEPIPDGNMAFLIKKWQPYRKRKYGKQKIKKFEVNAEQLESMVNKIQEVWFTLIEFKNDPKVVGMDKFEQFLKRNNIPLYEKLHERVEKFKELKKS